MERIITQTSFYKPLSEQLKRVAGYARVSSGKDAMLHSLSAQVSYYSEFIQKNHGWAYVGVYADEAKTGTKDSREGFQRLLADCHAGKIDLVITKSISRFARNTVTLLETVRKLKSLGIDVYFEEQNIHTMSADGELMLSILASYAQEESRSASENQKWRVRKNFNEGIPWNGTVLGYLYEKGQYIIVPEEAEIVRQIYSCYTSGWGVMAIVKTLNANHLNTRNGNLWCKSSVMKVLRNYSYTGNLLLQKTFRRDYLSKWKLENNGELPKYHALHTHEAIIPLDTFEKVQSEIARRAEKHTHPGSGTKVYPFTGLLTCNHCGKHYRRKVTPTGSVWICSTYNTLGKAACTSKQIPENTLMTVAAEVLGTNTFDSNAFHNKITAVRAAEGNTLVFCFKDGTEIVKRWSTRSRAESWTAEMRDAARKNKQERDELRCRQPKM